jgi:hypothetical protein
MILIAGDMERRLLDFGFRKADFGHFERLGKEKKAGISGLKLGDLI